MALSTNCFLACINRKRPGVYAIAAANAYSGLFQSQSARNTRHAPRLIKIGKRAEHAHTLAIRYELDASRSFPVARAQQSAGSGARPGSRRTRALAERSRHLAAAGRGSAA